MLIYCDVCVIYCVMLINIKNCAANPNSVICKQTDIERNP